MPSRAALDAFIAEVVSGDHVRAIRDWYAKDASMQENQSEPRRGREELLAREAAVMERTESVLSELVDPPLIDGERVALRWRFTFRFKGGGGFVQEEIAWQTWDGDKVMREIFFYDPAQRRVDPARG